MSRPTPIIKYRPKSEANLIFIGADAGELPASAPKIVPLVSRSRRSVALIIPIRARLIPLILGLGPRRIVLILVRRWPVIGPRTVRSGIAGVIITRRGRRRISRLYPINRRQQETIDEETRCETAEEPGGDGATIIAAAVTVVVMSVMSIVVITIARITVAVAAIATTPIVAAISTASTIIASGVAAISAATTIIPAAVSAATTITTITAISPSTTSISASGTASASPSGKALDRE